MCINILSKCFQVLYHLSRHAIAMWMSQALETCQLASHVTSNSLNKALVVFLLCLAIATSHALDPNESTVSRASCKTFRL